MIKISEYFEGKVKSLGQELNGQKFTVGIMEPGEYSFSTASPELMSVVYGSMEARLPDGSKKIFSQGEQFNVPGKSQFMVKVTDPVSYICFYD